VENPSEDYLTDQERDAETDLHYFGARYYDPWVGRFLSQDPALIGAEAGVSFNLLSEDPQRFNSYSYALNRPTVMIDVNGEAAGAIIRGVITGGRIVARPASAGAELAGIVGDVRTVLDSNASTGERVIAGISLASGIPGGWLKSVFKIADKGKDARSTTKAATGSENAADSTKGADFSADLSKTNATSQSAIEMLVISHLLQGDSRRARRNLARPGARGCWRVRFRRLRWRLVLRSARRARPRGPVPMQAAWTMEMEQDFRCWLTEVKSCADVIADAEDFLDLTYDAADYDDHPRRSMHFMVWIRCAWRRLRERPVQRRRQ